MKDYNELLRSGFSALGLSFDAIHAVRAASERVAGQPSEGCEDKEGLLLRLREEMGDCTRCRLHETRTKLVFGTGNPCTDVMFVGEAPGEDEDIKGEPFVGRAGRLLDLMIGSIGLSRKTNTYIANVLKSRPPGNKISDVPDCIPVCLPFLLEQIRIVSPRVICCLGATAAQTLLRTNTPITKLRGHFIEWDGGIKLLPTYHPSYLLRSPIAKRDVWDDMKKLRDMLQALKEE